MSDGVNCIIDGTYYVRVLKIHPPALPPTVTSTDLHVDIPVIHPPSSGFQCNHSIISTTTTDCNMDILSTCHGACVSHTVIDIMDCFDALD